MQIEFTDKEVEHMLWVLTCNRESDEIYGNRKEYWKRAGDIQQKLTGTPCIQCGQKFYDPTHRPFCSEQCKNEYR